MGEEEESEFPDPGCKRRGCKYAAGSQLGIAGLIPTPATSSPSSWVTPPPSPAISCLGTSRDESPWKRQVQLQKKPCSSAPPPEPSRSPSGLCHRAAAGVKYGARRLGPRLHHNVTVKALNRPGCREGRAKVNRAGFGSLKAFAVSSERLRRSSDNVFHGQNGKKVFPWISSRSYGITDLYFLYGLQLQQSFIIHMLVWT